MAPLDKDGLVVSWVILLRNPELMIVIKTDQAGYRVKVKVV